MAVMTGIINQKVSGREMVLTVANWNAEKQAILETFQPSSCIEVPMSLEDIFLECTRPNTELIPASMQEV